LPLMRRLRSFLLAFACLVVLVPVSSAGADGTTQDAALARGISRALSSHGFTGTGTGVAVADLATGEIIYRHNGWRRLLPASTEKRCTTWGALGTLRPTFRFDTRVVGAGTQQGTTWNGDLYLVGSGDPTFSSADVAALAAQANVNRIRRNKSPVPRART